MLAYKQVCQEAFAKILAPFNILISKASIGNLIILSVLKSHREKCLFCGKFHIPME
jgi:hypothetical protein